MYKAYKAEFTLGLIGAILGIVAFVIILIVGVVIGAAGVLTYAFGGGGLLALAIIAVILALVGFILGFVGSSKLNKNEKSGGILLIVAGGLFVITLFLAFIVTWYSIFPAALLLTGGIMAVVKKPQVPPAPQAPPVQ